MGCSNDNSIEVSKELNINPNNELNSSSSEEDIPDFEEDESK